MDQFRQVGEAVGGLKALMVLKHEIAINQRQCSLLCDTLTTAFETISEEIKQNLSLEDRNIKWKALELPMKDLHRVFKESELYIKHCMDVKDWWGKAISLHMNRDCVEFHIHNLLCCFPIVIEAIETASEISGLGEEDMQKRRSSIVKKYDREFDDPKFFSWKFGKQHLVSRDICARLDSAWREDRWLLLEKTREKRSRASKHELRLAELLLSKLSNEAAETSNENILPIHVLVGSQDYYVKRRLGCSTGVGHFKEIHWLGENFALRTFYGEIGPLSSEISLILTLSHPNVLQHLCAFYDEERKEGHLVMELMSKDLHTHVRENSGQKKRIPFGIPVAVDIMLQIARGMEYLHSRKIYHGDLNPSKVLLKPRNAASNGLFHAKVAGFGLHSIKSYASKNSKTAEPEPEIWLAPEVLSELEQPGSKSSNDAVKSMARYTEKADVYSFGMLCFELLSGKVPFEDSHLQGEKMVRNIRAGERPLFSYPAPKYLANLTRKCWQTNPNQRPTFSSICRILRYIKKNLVINPDHGDPNSPPPLVDYCDMESGFLKKFPGEISGGDLSHVSQIPFQMFAYKLFEKDKVCGKNWDLTGNEELSGNRSAFGDEHLAAMDDLLFAQSDRRSVCSEIIDRKNNNMVVDFRSVTSEIPQRKPFSFDRRSIGSDQSPGRKSLGTVANGTPERKWDQSENNKTDHQKPKVEVNGDKMGLKLAEHQLASSRLQENGKHPMVKVAEEKLEHTEIIPETMKHSSRTKTVDHKLEEIPEKKTLHSVESVNKNAPVSSRTSTKKPKSAGSKRAQKSRESSEKKPLVIRTVKDSTKNKNSPEKSCNESPRSSPARTKKPISNLSPASSPSRSFKTSASPKRSNDRYSSSPSRSFVTCASPKHSYDHGSSSPSRPFVTCASPKHSYDHGGSSPSRPFVTCASPKHSFDHGSSSPSRLFISCDSPKHSHDLCSSSPAASPVHPCSRFSRLGRQSSLPPLSPRRPVKEVKLQNQ